MYFGLEISFINKYVTRIHIYRHVRQEVQLKYIQDIRNKIQMFDNRCTDTNLPHKENVHFPHPPVVHSHFIAHKRRCRFILRIKG